MPNHVVLGHNIDFALGFEHLASSNISCCHGQLVNWVNSAGISQEQSARPHTRMKHYSTFIMEVLF